MQGFVIPSGRREEPYKESFTRKETWKKNQVFTVKVTRKFLGSTRDLGAPSVRDQLQAIQAHGRSQGGSSPAEPSEPSKSSFLPLCSLHPHLPPFLFNPDKGNVSDKRALLPLERDRAPACAKRRSGSNLSSHLISHGKPIRQQGRAPAQPLPPGARHTRGHCPP